MTRVRWGKLSLSSKDDRLQETVHSSSRVLPQDDVLTQTTLLNESIGWHYNAVLTGVYFKRAGNIWKAVVKCEMASGPKVAYFTGTSLYQLVETVHWYASKGVVEWHRDKRPVRVSARQPRLFSPRRL